MKKSQISDKVLILTGTGRSGTTYMVGLLRRVYGFGLSAEVKDILKLNENLIKLNLHSEADFVRGIEQVSQSRVLRHAISKNIISRVDKEMIKDFVAERNPQGLLMAMLRYVAVIREADPNLPAFKDTGALGHLTQLRALFPNARVINMIRRGEDVAGSTLKFNWGATNHVAGVLDWRNTLTKAMKDLQAFPEGRVLNLRLEDAENDRETFVQSLDSFLAQNYQEQGLSPQADRLRKELAMSFEPIKSYPLGGFVGMLVKKLAANLNQRLGYEADPVSSFRRLRYSILAWPYYFWDRLLRLIRIFKRKL